MTTNDGNEQPRQYQQSMLDRAYSHDIAAEVGEIVESRILKRAATFLLLNAAALITAIATGIGAYYSLDKRSATAEARIDINTQRIERLITEQASIRGEIRDNQQTIIQQNNSLANYLREHDRNQQIQMQRIR